MRPPVLPSGNLSSVYLIVIDSTCFNEAAGFTQRKRHWRDDGQGGHRKASMRPPVLPSGNRSSATDAP